MIRKLLRWLCVLLVVILLIGLFPVTVNAFETRSGGTVTVSPGELVDGDLYLAGSTMIVDGTVNGDIFAAGQTLTINGPVNGGVIFFGQTITVNGNVTGGVRSFGQSVIINGSVGRDLMVGGSDVTIGSNGLVGGDAALGVSNALVNGRVRGNVRGSAAETLIAGQVEGNVDLNVGTLTVASGAVIAGSLNYRSSRDAVIQPGATIGGTMNRNEPAPFRTFWRVASVAGFLFGFLTLFLLGLIIILLAAGKVGAMADAIQYSPWRSLGWGAIILFATPIAAVIVMITVVGIPLGLIALFLYALAVYLSSIPVALLIGRLIIPHDRLNESRGQMIGALALGLVLLLLLRLVPYIGWIIGLATVLFGLGSLITARTGRPGGEHRPVQYPLPEPRSSRT